LDATPMLLVLSDIVREADEAVVGVRVRLGCADACGNEMHRLSC